MDSRYLPTKNMQNSQISQTPQVSSGVRTPS